MKKLAVTLLALTALLTGCLYGEPGGRAYSGDNRGESRGEDRGDRDGGYDRDARERDDEDNRRDRR